MHQPPAQVGVVVSLGNTGTHLDLPPDVDVPQGKLSGLPPQFLFRPTLQHEERTDILKKYV